MSKISTVCKQCGITFERFQSYHNQAEKRGKPIQFCSLKCLGLAKSAGIVGTKKKTGETLNCEVCNTAFYAVKSKVESQRFCSEPCRINAFKAKLIDRTAPRPDMLKGEEIACVICGNLVYRKASYIKRGINKTCGDPQCLSTYGRADWGLAPRVYITPKQARKKRDVFTSAQRATWKDTMCAKCGSFENLTLDHIIPVCCGGLSIKENCQTLCQSCNTLKGNTSDKLLSKSQNQSGGF